MAVYTFDRTDGLVKIVKRKGGYYVYRLKEVIVDKTYSKPRGMYIRENRLGGLYIKPLKFIFETSAIKKHGYKPYENDDVSKTPSNFLNDILVWQSYKVRIKM